MDLLGQYVYYSEKLYINEKIIFNQYNKICDIAEHNAVGCSLNALQDAYEIQPNERDPRYVEMRIWEAMNGE